MTRYCSLIIGAPSLSVSWRSAATGFAGFCRKPISAGYSCGAPFFAGDLDADPVAMPSAHGGYSVRSVSFSPDGTKIVSGGNDGTIKVWDAGGPLRPSRPHRALL